MIAQANLRIIIKKIFIFTSLFLVVATLSGCDSVTGYYFVNRAAEPVQFQAKGRLVHSNVDINATVDPQEEIYIGLVGLGKLIVDLDSLVYSFDEISISDKEGNLLLNRNTLKPKNLSLKKGLFYYDYYLVVLPSDLETTEKP